MAPMKRNRLFSARLMPTLVAMATALVAVSGQVQELEGVGCGCVTDKVIYDEHSCTSACDNCSGQGCAADSGAQFSQFNKALGDPAAAYEGSEGIRVTPTYWHDPFFRIATGRTDFRCHGFLEFMIKATATDGRPLRQRLVLSDQTQGSYVNLEDYVEDGVIDNTKWRKVSIPMIELASDTFQLNSVFMMSFVRMMGNNCFDVCGESCYDNPSFYRASCDDPQDFFIDNVFLKPGIIGPKIKGSGVSSARVVTLRVDVMDRDSSAAAAAAASGSAFALTSEQDANFATPVVPIKVGYSRAPTYADEKGAVKEEWTVHLLYPTDKKMLPGVQYTVTGLSSALVDCSGNTAAQNSFPVIFGATDVSTSIQVNQLGYLPKQPKHAYVANWLGDAGGMPVDEESRVFHIVDSSDTTNIRYTGDLVLRFADDVQAGSDVYDVVFSDFQEPGNYRVSVPGIGLSYSFDINDTVLAPAAYATTRLLYYKRNIKLEEPYVDYGLVREPINSTLDGVFHPLLETYSLNNGESALEFKQIQPGWFDAGDYGHYMHNAWYIWPAFGMVFDLATKLPQDGELNIPESGNGVPDLLDELEFGMTWAMSMQADDGGVYWRLASRYFDQVLPKDVSLPRIIYEKTTRATAQFAGMAAIHSRLLRPYNAARADEVLAAGIKAWDFIQSHESYPPEGTAYRNPSEMPGGGEYSSTTSLPDQFWAAAELYRSTGDIRFQDAYADLRGRAVIDPSGSPHSTYMYWAMAMSDHPNIDVVLRESARRILMSTADQKLERGAGHPYRVSKHPHIPWSGWHGQSGSVIYAPALLQAYYLTGNTTYSDAAFTSVDMSLGANPLSQVFITGIGHKPVLDPLDRVSLDDGIEQPVPGMPSPGFTWHLPGFREPYISINNAFYPSERVVDNRYNESYPVLRRYLDSHAAIPHNEGTIREAAMYAAPLTIMSDGEHPPKVDGSYEWTWKGRTHVRSQVYVPMAEIPLIFPSYFTEWGGYVGQAPAEYLNVLTSEQICAINAPTTPNWVGRLSDEKKEAICEHQIVAFEHYSLIIRLPPSKVPMIPCEKLPTLGIEIRNTSPEWKAALTTEQISCLSPEQYEWLGFTSPPTSAPTAPTPSPSSQPTRLTLAPTSYPTSAPTPSPTSQPTRLTLAPTKRPTSAPSLRGTTSAPSRHGTASPVSAAETIVIGELSSDDKLIYDEHTCTSACDNCSGQGCAADSGAQFSQFNKALGDPAAAYEGSEGIRVTPTYWHDPFFRIATGRTDFSSYESLDFMIKATAADGRPLRQRLVLSDASKGSYVDLENYVADGVIDNTKWRKVSIPIADLVSPEFALARVFIMSFVRMMGNNCFDICGESCYDNPTFYSASCDTPQDFYIDNIVLKAF